MPMTLGMNHSSDQISPVDKPSRLEFVAQPGVVELVGLVSTVILWILLRNRLTLGSNVGGYVIVTGAIVTASMTLVARLQQRVVLISYAHVRAIEHRAVHDELTGLPTRTELARRLEAAISDAYRHDAVVGVLFLDLDGFKAVNDSMGHLAGDELLRRFALRLSASVRAGDLVARVGGDEFVVVAVGQDNERAVRTVAEHLRKVFEVPITLTDGEVNIVPSIGVAVASRRHPAMVEDLLTHADQAMYRAKRSGSGIFVFDDNQRREINDRREVERELVPALASGQFQVYYQPIVSASKNATVGFEGLIRWQHPTQGVIGPERFLAVAEEAGLVARLGEVVLREVAAQISVWNHLAADGQSMSVAVNLAERQLVDPSFPDRVAEIVTWAGIEPQQLDLEIREELLLRRAADSSQVIRRLSDMGCRIVVDDFGNIEGSVSKVKSVTHVDVVKIDRSITATLQNDEFSQAVVESTVSLARSVGIQVVAQGVETEQQRDHLVRLGVDQMQGFLFLEPSPPESVDLAGMLSEDRRLNL